MIELYAKFLRPYWKKVVLIVILSMLATVCSLLLPMMSKRIIDEGVLSGENVSYGGTVALMAVIAVLSMLFPAVNGKFIAETAMGFSRNLRKEFFAHVLSLSQRDLDQFGTASLISRQGNDIMQMQLGLVQLLTFMLTAPLMCIGGFLIALLTSPRLAWIVLAAILLCLLFVAFVVGTVRKIFLTYQQKLDSVNRLARESLNGMRVIRAFNKEESEKTRFSNVSREVKETSSDLHRYLLMFPPVMSFIVNFANVLVLWFGARYMTEHLTTYGDIQAFIQYLSLIVFGMMMLSAGLIVLPRVQSAGSRITEVLRVTPSIRDAEKPQEMAEHISALEFKGVSFRYGEGGANALSDISFKVSAGQTLAIIGGTGAGKSTLLNLIPRYYDISEGAILVNGCDIRNLRQAELRKHIGVAPQKAFLFGGSIMDNLRRGKPDATEEEANHALDVAQSRDFVEEKEYGLYTALTPGGTNLSGGQRQRLSIARAVIRKPDIYLFDDSFSALDFKTDAALRRALAKETKNAIVIIVAQRISTIKSADQILVLENGKLVGQGTHSELLAGNAVYREIAQSQLSREEMEA
ncbi:MAG: ABC transporter ATP-binding protein [Oscillospiraceae bacterium]|nr:ABC transporter ATP-binding protein [Oscillospiraceae bacterium]